MPIVIFLAQRLVLFLLAILTFLGLSSEERYFSVEQAFAIQQERKPEIVELLEQNPDIINKNPETPNLDVDPIDVPIPTSTTPTGSTNSPNTEGLPPDFIDVVQKEIDAIRNSIGDIIKKEEVPEAKNTETASNQQEEVAVIENDPSNAVLNVVCLEKIGRTISITTGSAVIITKSGYVLTNGHVAKSLLRQDRDAVDCELKHPDHPTMNFRAAIQYIPEEWTNGTHDGSTTGTGEKDYAILKIVGPGPSGVMLKNFPYITPNTSDKEIYEGNDILLLAYPGKQAGVYEIDTNLPLVTDISTIQEVFTFDRTSSDVFSSGISPVAKQGSSGGAVVDNGKLLGIIVTTNNISGGSVLNALSLDYIDRDLKKQGLSISYFK